ncbi:MAG: carboxypeptidase regulatory-like domain-containing protein, partial [Bdellovibrionales bacterium]|nr:carboxypeptidase regulatory-like domain-containing protein [Bdellovibrionales bacterium]
DVEMRSSGAESPAIEVSPFVANDEEESEAGNWAVVAGRCVDRERRPLEGAVIRILLLGGPDAVRSGMRGAVVGRSRAGGVFGLRVDLRQSGSRFYLQFEHRSAGGSELLVEPGLELQLQPEELRDVGDVVLGATNRACLQGRVIESRTGLPLQGVSLHLYPRGLGKPLSVDSAEDGSFLVRGLGFLSHELQDYPRYMVGLELGSAARAVQAIDVDYVPLQVTPEEHEFSIFPGETSRVEFVVSAGPPAERVSRIEVALDDVQGKEYLLLGKSGEVLLIGGTLGKGGWGIVDQSVDELRPFEPLAAEVVASNGELLRLPTVIEGGGLHAGPAVRTIPVVPVEGIVRDRDGRRVPNAVVVFNLAVRSGYSTMNYREVHCDGHGVFSLRVPAGDYQVVAVRDEARLGDWSLEMNPTQRVSVPTKEQQLPLVVW